MKFLRIVVIIVIIMLASCTTTDYKEVMDDEFYRIVDMVPKKLTQDILLPDASALFEINYYLEETYLEDRWLNYIPSNKDQTLYIRMELTYEERIGTYHIAIEQEADIEAYNEYVLNDTFEEVFTDIEVYFPDRVVSNVTLRYSEIPGVSTFFQTTCSTIERGRLKYSFPNEDTECMLSARIKILGETRILEIPYIMSSVDNLPQIPQVYVTTTNSSSIDSNIDFTQVSITVESDSYLPSEIIDAAAGMRLRGNSTLWMPKKSYKIKFEEKQKFLSQYREHDWVLLANFTDQTLVRNFLAYQLAGSLNMAGTPTYTFIDLHINGEYQGNYLLTDQVEVTSHRVPIEENVSDIDTGYLIEYDLGLYREGLENTDDNFFMVEHIPFVLHSPSNDDLHYRSGHKDYIETYMNDLLNTLRNQEDYTGLIDEASFVDWFIVNELFKNVDSGYSSVYYYKDKGEPLKMGPVWDFDLSTGNQGHANQEDRGPTGWYTSRQDKNIYFYYLLQYPEFQQALKTRWNQVYNLHLVPMLDRVFTISDSITHSRYQNFQKWDVIGKNQDWYTAPEIYDLKTYDEQVWFLHDYLVTRLEWLNEEINKF